MGGKSKLLIWIPLDPKLISNDQVGSEACAHTKFFRFEIWMLMTIIKATKLI